MKKFAPLGLPLVALLLSGCPADEDPKVNLADQASEPKWEQVFGKPSRVKLQAKVNFATAYFGPKNYSGGTYTSQVTVSQNKTKGFTSGQSQGALEIFRNQDGGDFIIYTLAAIYDAPSAGFVVRASSYQSGAPPLSLTYGSAPFANTPAVDLRVQQTDAQLTLLARATALSGAAPGTWTTIATVAAQPGENSDRLLTGIANVDKGGYFYFSDLRADGSAIGGTVEHPIIAQCEAADDAIHDTQAKLAAIPPDLNGAAATLQTAADQIQAAMTALGDADTVSQLQTTTRVSQALVLLQAANQKIVGAQAAVATGKISRVRLQKTPLKVAAGAMEGAVLNLLGNPAPNLKSRPELFSWHVD